MMYRLAIRSGLVTKLKKYVAVLDDCCKYWGDLRWRVWNE